MKKITIVLTAPGHDSDIKTLEDLFDYLANELDNHDIPVLLQIEEVPGHA